jgi:hypothetical protein
MADDVTTPSNPTVAIVNKEELEVTLDETPLDETPLDGTPLDKIALEVNVSQRSREEEPSRRVMRTQVDRLAWDCRLSLNPHALAIYLEFVLA